PVAVTYIMSPTAWRRVRRVVKGKWWAHEDSNLGQTDYEAVELGAF
ncbi:MAG: hypothetical protein ACI9B8_001825, partial [Sulfitobacter sp.]